MTLFKSAGLLAWIKGNIYIFHFFEFVEKTDFVD